MNKAEFTTHIAKQHDCTKAKAEQVIDMFVSAAIGVIGEGKELSLVGFGNFTISKVPARDGHNPKTREPMKIAAYNQPKFKAGKTLKDKVNNK